MRCYYLQDVFSISQAKKCFDRWKICCVKDESPVPEYVTHRNNSFFNSFFLLLFYKTLEICSLLFELNTHLLPNFFSVIIIVVQACK